jgi:protein-tyrosine phosphatase
MKPINMFLPIIEEGLSQNKKILVHCLMGLSRSPSIIVAYLMKKNSWSFDEAVKFVNSKRTHPININLGFTYKLMKFNND